MLQILNKMTQVKYLPKFSEIASSHAPILCIYLPQIIKPHSFNQRQEIVCCEDIAFRLIILLLQINEKQNTRKTKSEGEVYRREGQLGSQASADKGCQRNKDRFLSTTFYMLKDIFIHSLFSVYHCLTLHQVMGLLQ